MISLICIVLVCFFLLVVAWVLYNFLILAVGVKNLRRNKGEAKNCSSKEGKLYSFSIIVPIKNEEKVIGRLLDALLRLRYPKDKMEIIIVEDGSTDGSLNISMKYVEKSSGLIKVLHKPTSNGKPSALNYGIKHASGEIIAVFDADNVPEPDILINVCKYFKDPKVAAVQGRTLSINQDENMLTKLISYEEAVSYEAYLRGKDVLELFVHLKGSCQFIRRDILKQIGGFREVLSEDMELSARLTEKGYCIKYAPDVRSWQETPSNVRQLFKQRTRWFRGTVEVAVKYGRLMIKPSRKNIDAETTLSGPFILIASILTYFAGLYTSTANSNFNAFFYFLMQLSVVGTSVMLIVCGLALAYISRPRKLTNLLWLPFIYIYWSLQSFIALYAVLLILLRRPQRWIKTEKTGVIKTENCLFL
ncbi:MAG TPA: glycosyltransferase family 2 protein [Candidatus Bathyarchaeota archaeon]|nr:glycosyltransferase family 2 protein [Candidatus Bathyarchaeota archaeon]